MGPGIEWKNKCGKLFISLFCLFFIPTLSMAGSFRISPVRIQFDDGTRTTSVRITNDGNERVTIQLNVREWSQDDKGTDVYKKTEDIVFFPRIVTIEKSEERIIRIGYQGQERAATEKTYRLFLEELPVGEPGETALKFALNIVVPIYVNPLKEMKKPSIEKIQFSSGHLSVKVKNSGNVHFLIGKVTAVGLDNLGKEVFRGSVNGRSVLAGASKTLEVEIPEKECLETNKLNVMVEVDQDTMEEELALDRAQCFDKTEGKEGPGEQPSR